MKLITNVNDLIDYFNTLKTDDKVNFKFPKSYPRYRNGIMTYIHGRMDFIEIEGFVKNIETFKRGRIDDFLINTKLKRKDWPDFMYLIRTFDIKSLGYVSTLTIDMEKMCEGDWEKDYNDLIKCGNINKKIYETYLKVPDIKIPIEARNKILEKRWHKDLMADDWEVVNELN